MTDEEAIERLKPWAVVLQDVLEMIDAGSQMTFGRMIFLSSLARGVGYPPPDVEEAILRTVARRLFAGAPAPKGFA